MVKKGRVFAMKRFISVLSSLLVLPAFAEVAPVYYDDVVEYTDELTEAENSVTNAGSAQQNVAGRPVINRSTSVTRAVSSAPNASSRTGNASRAVASSPRTATAGTNRGTVARTTKSTNVVSRAPNASRTAVSARNAQSASRAETARIGIRGNVMSGSRDGNNVTVLSGTNSSVYNPSASSRIGIANRRASARLSTPVISTTTPTTAVTKEDVSVTTEQLTNIAELTELCKSQYMACMDNYCNVLDDNQGRCSCSKNIRGYEKAEAALTEATEKFQEVIQQIRYIGLTTDQVESLFSETEAELSMKSNTDKSRLKNSLDAIKKKIVDVSTPSATSTAFNSGISLDLNGLLTADFSSGFDLASFLNTQSNDTSSVTNQRGEQLYKTAAARCKTAVLNSCSNQGIEINIITNAYDLEIDKQCVLYERSLNDANTEMRANVTNATTILQQARLLLAQNKNSYDFRGCIAALDACMQDEYVCGSDYELCVDPSGKYIADGELIKGGTPGVSGGQPRNTKTICGYDPQSLSLYEGSSSYVEDNTEHAYSATDNSATCVAFDEWQSGGMWNLYSTWDYKDASGDTGNAAQAYKDYANAWSFGNNESLGAYVDYWLNEWKSNYTTTKTFTDTVAMNLLQKIGYIDANGKTHGMCSNVLKQCQDYTFDQKKRNKKTAYIPNNEVVRQYLNSTLGKIKAQQDAIIDDYANGCRADVQACLSSNGYEEDNEDTTASKTAINVCASEITTCMSVGGYQIDQGVKLTLRAMADWVKSILKNCPANTQLVDDGIGGVKCAPCGSALVVVNAGYMTNGNTANADAPYAPSTLFDQYYKLPSETNPNYLGKAVGVPLESAGGRVMSCSCPDGYEDYYVKAGGADSALEANLKVGGLVCVDTKTRCTIQYKDEYILATTEFEVCNYEYCDNSCLVCTGSGCPIQEGEQCPGTATPICSNGETPTTAVINEVSTYVCGAPAQVIDGTLSVCQ